MINFTIVGLAILQILETRNSDAHWSYQTSRVWSLSDNHINVKQCASTQPALYSRTTSWIWINLACYLGSCHFGSSALLLPIMQDQQCLFLTCCGVADDNYASSCIGHFKQPMLHYQTACDCGFLLLVQTSLNLSNYHWKSAPINSSPWSWTHVMGWG